MELITEDDLRENSFGGILDSPECDWQRGEEIKAIPQLIICLLTLVFCSCCSTKLSLLFFSPILCLSERIKVI